MDYNMRIHILDSALSKISENNYTKFWILSIIHYICLTALYLCVFFINNIWILTLILGVFVVQTILNIMDNGCFLMKLERKYVGKWWFGMYTILNFIIPNTCLIDAEHSVWLFYLLNIVGGFVISTKIYSVYMNQKEEVERNE